MDGANGDEYVLGEFNVSLIDLYLHARLTHPVSPGKAFCPRNTD